MSRDVVFYEMASWYADVKDDIGADVRENVAAENTGAQSHRFLVDRKGHLVEALQGVLGVAGCVGK